MKRIHAFEGGAESVSPNGYRRNLRTEATREHERNESTDGMTRKFTRDAYPVTGYFGGWRRVVRNRIAFRCAVYPRQAEASADLWHAVY